MDDIVTKLQPLVNIKFGMLNNGEQTGYYYVSHTQGKHQIYIVLYDNAGIHEVIDPRELKSNLKIHKSYPLEKHNISAIKKHVTPIPNKESLEALL